MDEMTERREYELIRNSHMLVDIGKMKEKSTFKLRTVSPKTQEEEVAVVMKRKR